MGGASIDQTRKIFLTKSMSSLLILKCKTHCYESRCKNLSAAKVQNTPQGGRAARPQIWHHRKHKRSTQHLCIYGSKKLQCVRFDWLWCRYSMHQWDLHRLRNPYAALKPSHNTHLLTANIPLLHNLRTIDLSLNIQGLILIHTFTVLRGLTFNIICGNDFLSNLYECCFRFFSQCFFIVL